VRQSDRLPVWTVADTRRCGEPERHPTEGRDNSWAAWLLNLNSDRAIRSSTGVNGMSRGYKTQRGRPGRLRGCWLGYGVGALFVLILMQTSCARASVALLMEEPFGEFGAMNPTGHAAVYLKNICAASPTELRPCHAGEYGVVISRYHKIGGLDWIAMPLIPYLYAVDDVNEVPTSVDPDQVAALRDAYRRKHLEALAPDNKKGRTPRGEWVQLVGSSYDRTIHGFQVVSTAQQDQRFIALFNDRRNVGHFNLVFHNCADFSRAVLDIYLPGAVHRSFVADLGLTTPKQLARALVKYDQKHPETEMSAFVIPQVAGSVKRSKPVKGVTESLLKSKKYLLPMTVLAPELTGGMVVAYLTGGRMKLPDDATVFDVDDQMTLPHRVRTPCTPAPQGGGSPTALPATGAEAPSLR
jgi:hypothetical protein